MPWHDPIAPDFPLPEGHAFAMDDGTRYTHSGARWRDRKWIRQIQRRVGVNADGRYGFHTAAAVERFQRRHGLAVDGAVGPRTWFVMFKG
jgi:peptidoglycan hydrolase-like protein with peptidoglycan-binding domain